MNGRTVYVWDGAVGEHSHVFRPAAVRHEWHVEDRSDHDGARVNVRGPFQDRATAMFEAEQLAGRAHTPDSPVRVRESTPPAVKLPAAERDEGIGVFIAAGKPGAMGVAEAREIVRAALDGGHSVTETGSPSVSPVEAMWRPGGEMFEQLVRPRMRGV